MISLIKGLMPDFIKDILRPFKHALLDRSRYLWLLWYMPKKHKKLIKKLRNKKTIRVAFLVSEKSKWKADEVFQLMQKDSYFNPFVIAIPFHKWDEENRKVKVQDIKSHFQNKGYEVYSHFQDNKQIINELKNADLVFFSEPYDVARDKKYYADLFANKLCFYIPYFFMATSHVKGSALKFNGIYYPFLLSMWKIYWPHNEIKAELKEFDSRALSSSCVTGYPAMEYLYKESQSPTNAKSAWKSSAKNKVKIIYAPHHSVFENDPARETLSTFLKNAEVIKGLAAAYNEIVSWSFKPHPLLIHHLYEHPDWGKEKADAYYQFWREQEYTQFDDGVYDDLFLQSDAIIHDCSSFIVEYAFTQKPCLYLVGETDIDNHLNEFGKGVIGVYQKARTAEQIEEFVKGLIDGNDRATAHNTLFFNQYLQEFYHEQLPSQRIINDLKQSLGF